MTNNKTKFEAGKTYGTRSACDHDCIFKFKVVRRTEKSVWLECLSGIKKGTYRAKIQDFRNDEELCSPLGSYSMAPLLGANDLM